MAKKMLIDATHAEETRVVVVDGNKVEEFDFESENKRQLAGNIYLAKVTRVEPSLQAAFVDYGGNRHGFLAFSEIHPDYYQIPVADREALMEEERAYAEAMRARDEEEDKPKPRRRSRSKAARADNGDAVATAEPENNEISGMETIDLEGDTVPEGTSPMETVGETPVAEPEEADAGEESNGGAETVEKDTTIESVADDDDVEDIRLPRKPRPRRYKIQEVIKVRQIMLVQVVKEERGNKGAALTTYLSLAGRYCVLMPNTARGGGISRKITNAVDRKKLKTIANEIDVPRGAGLIIRTAGAKRTKSEIKRDYEYLFRLWEQIRQLTLESIAPAKIYEEGDLIKRSIRDLYNRDIDEVFVEGERGYRIAKDFMKMIMPSHAKNVKHYTDALPLFARYQVESYLSSMFNPTVQLKSGGYIVIGVTEALVAIDVNSGRATKEGSIEETALKTNLEAAEEVARQLRLRDLAGLIVIDFIDMDERKNNAAVEKKLKDKLKTDRARIQVGRISGFGLLEMSRQRLRPGMIEATTQPCPHCHGTGLIRSDDNLALSILRQIEEEGTRRRSREVLVKAPVGIANYLMNQKREHVAQIEARYGMAVRIEGDPMLVSPDFSLEKFKTATRIVAEVSAPVVSVDTSLMDAIDEDTDGDQVEEQATESETVTETEDETKPKKRRRRRRSRRPKSASRDEAETQEGTPKAESAEDAPQPEAEAEPAAAPADEPAPEDKPARKPRSRKPRATEKPKDDGAEAAEKPKRKPRSRKSTKPEVEAAKGDEGGEAPTPEAKPEDMADAPAKAPTPRSRSPKPKQEAAAPEEPKAEPADKQPEPAPTAAAEPAPEATPQAEAPAAPPAPEPAAPTSAATDEPEDDKKPKRRGWWSLGR
ncbi:Rne/Rng family ribonuclease [Lutimaribacter sp. EGI FJ00015]|uniref:Rne/Rng family ribonuclease n=1 Tax=Lutimaribacter degradans TaxID=2945989 RepID=A0ACC5ZSM7_9RHOB|nr:Rne/Rng family ribonuclease [Lutimaribacter sp. EGI FJ00013]MCM2561150.1 Rne/Rng family ribonuclease [Lutimaribacter sp. EGI FJ00013]MCO0611901.1 Rne/Rng family ribonuclease [Lutimaribacter sp. EGI FJ00015]MCO0634978.1 Rne/Rng family ribonuclease [Lutimaribacter sp. EGI FJ00014]